VGKISARNNATQFVGIYRSISKNSTKMVITRERRPNEMYHFGAFDNLLRSILCTEFELENDLSVGWIPSLDQKSIQILCTNVWNVMLVCVFMIVLKNFIL
jgi:hypothetical protein